ncbi:TrmH family RNA methyltransferase [Catalinimonas alkaloidigena]|uniref:RNA methyltransferase n=1 Tax=Catalinimonas alkaloidigena TaxID=1075417 RepID=UPI002405D8A2|nr:RNA methyltransferase [Catalinimonas alkaloidigena]MDF9794852.1 TrmH family RNA methyltransferase [Catalinimonas alkaloidigena]
MISKRILKLIKSLQQKKYRKKYKLFLVEGGKNILELLSTHFSIRTLIATPVFIEVHKDLINKHEVAEIISTDEKQLSTASTLKSNNAAIAIVEIPENLPYQSSPGAYELVLDDINDPGNLGTILRIADWYGIPQIICSPETTDLYSPKVISASMGSFLRVNVFYMDLESFFKKNRKPVYAAYAAAGENVHTLNFSKEGVLLMGSESHGIHPRYAKYVNCSVHIPSYGKAESLNVSIATSVICDNMRRLSE